MLSIYEVRREIWESGEKIEKRRRKESWKEWGLKWGGRLMRKIGKDMKIMDVM